MKTSPRQPSRSGREKSMFSQADFPVSPSAMQEAEKERKMTATSGLKCYERFPGEKYVDMLGVDVYEFDNSDANYQQNLAATLDVLMEAAKKVGKIPAITEESSRGNRGFTGFPSVQPTICRGDDGLPFDVDDLAISEGKWRKESIKAYGNAWVPQVALEIFKAIEEYNNN